MLNYWLKRHISCVRWRIVTTIFWLLFRLPGFKLPLFGGLVLWLLVLGLVIFGLLGLWMLEPGLLDITMRRLGLRIPRWLIVLRRLLGELPWLGMRTQTVLVREFRGVVAHTLLVFVFGTVVSKSLRLPRMRC